MKFPNVQYNMHHVILLLRSYFIGGQAGNIRARFEKMANEGAEVGAMVDGIHTVLVAIATINSALLECGY